MSLRSQRRLCGFLILAVIVGWTAYGVITIGTGVLFAVAIIASALVLMFGIPTFFVPDGAPWNQGKRWEG